MSSDKVVAVKKVIDEFEKINSLQKDLTKVKSYLFDTRLVLGRLAMKMTRWKKQILELSFQVSIINEMEREIENLEGVMKRT